MTVVIILNSLSLSVWLLSISLPMVDSVLFQKATTVVVATLKWSKSSGQEGERVDNGIRGMGMEYISESQQMVS